MQTLYPAVVNSPGTTLVQAISAGADVIPLVDASKVSSAPGLVTLGYSENAETVLFTGKNLTNNTLTGCTRGFQGNASAWGVGTPAGRFFTAYDFDALISNMSEVITAVTDVIPKSVLTTADDFIVAALVEGSITPVRKSLADVKTLLGLGTAAYTAAADYATAAQGALADAALPVSGGTLLGSLILHEDPTQSLEAVTKQYVDNLVAGLKWKTSAIAATTENITLSGLQTVDGISLLTGERVLVKNQTDPKENGIYVAVEGAWSRAVDANTGILLANSAILVEEGTTQHDKAWVCQNDTITIGVTEIVYVKFSGGLERVEASTTNGNILVDGNEVTVYTHPSSHAASIITEDETHRFVTDTEKTAWNGMIPLSVVTTEDDFIVASGNATVTRKSPADVRSLLNVTDGATKVEASATNGDIKINGTDTVVYTHPVSHAASIITEDSTHRFATDAEKTAWNGMVPLSTIAAQNDFIVGSGAGAVVRKTASEVRTILNVSDGANKTESSSTNGSIRVNGSEVGVYTHPASHAASIITEDATHRFATDTEKTAWNAMVPLSTVTTADDFIVATGSGAVTRKTPTNVRTILNVSDGANKTEVAATNGKVKVDGVEITVYSHPTGKQCTYAYEHPSAKQCTYEYTHPADKQCSYAYSHPAAKQCTGGDADTLDTHEASYFATADHSHSAATAEIAGFMSVADKTKLDNLPYEPSPTYITADSQIGLAHNHKRIFTNSASAIIVMIPTNSDVAFPVGSEIEFIRYGAGSVTFSPNSGVTLHSRDSFMVMDGQYSTAVLVKMDTDEWVLFGSLCYS